MKVTLLIRVGRRTHPSSESGGRIGSGLQPACTRCARNWTAFTDRVANMTLTHRLVVQRTPHVARCVQKRSP